MVAVVAGSSPPEAAAIPLCPRSASAHSDLQWSHTSQRPRRQLGRGHNRHVRTLRVALAQVNTTVGDLPGNARDVLAHTARAAESGAELVAFPEMMLTGYPVEDLVLRPAFRAASRAAVEKLAVDLADA